MMVRINMIKKRLLLLLSVSTAVVVFAASAVIYSYYRSTFPNPILSMIPVQHLNGTQPITLGNHGLAQEYAISMWLKPLPAQPEWAAIIDYRHTGTKSFAFHQKGDKANYFAFGVHSKGGVKGVYATLLPHRWQHVVLVKEAKAMAIYLNQVLVDRTTWDNNFQIDYAGDEILTLGGWGYGDRRWLGDLSCIYIFPKAIHESQIAKLAQQTQCTDARK